MITTTGGRCCCMTVTLVGGGGGGGGLVGGGFGSVVVDTVGVSSCRLRLFVNSILWSRLLGLQLSPLPVYTCVNRSWDCTIKPWNSPAVIVPLIVNLAPDAGSNERNAEEC